MNLRVVRFPISDNEYECILTNLPDNEFSIDEIKELYALRWGIETSFRELKYAVGLACFHSKKREYIIQEIWARLILYYFFGRMKTSVYLCCPKRFIIKNCLTFITYVKT